MSADKLVDSTMLDSDLTSVANAIRTKGGTYAPLLFPEDFVTAIMAISTGVKRRYTGDIVNFNMESSILIEVQIEPTQSGSGDPSPSNIRPISGWSEAELMMRGKNLYPFSTFPAYSYSWYSHRSFVDALNPVFLRGGVTYILSGERDSQYNSWFFMIRMFDINKQVVTDPTMATTTIGAFTTTYNKGGQYFFPKGAGSTYLYQTFTPSVDCWIDVVMQSGKGVALNAMIETGTIVATAYEPYNGTDITIDLDGTRYGGKLNVPSGVLTVTKANIANYAGETLPGEWISDRDVYAPGTTPTIGAQVVYDLETPQTVQLTSKQVPIIIGENTIWADTGNVTVEYAEIST